MRPQLQEFLEHELRQASEAEIQGDLRSAWRFLERAHILSQADAWPHIRVHCRMFAFAWRRRDAHELIGQWVRILVAGPGSLLGRAPLGNIGGSNVGLFTPMPIPEDLQAMLLGAGRGQAQTEGPGAASRELE